MNLIKRLEIEKRELCDFYRVLDILKNYAYKLVFIRYSLSLISIIRYYSILYYRNISGYITEISICIIEILDKFDSYVLHKGNKIFVIREEEGILNLHAKKMWSSKKRVSPLFFRTKIEVDTC